MESKDDKADKCYAAFVDGRWVRGCGYEECGLKDIVDSLINVEIGKILFSSPV
jgi:hypothetical protein